MQSHRWKTKIDRSNLLSPSPTQCAQTSAGSWRMSRHPGQAHADLLGLPARSQKLCVVSLRCNQTYLPLRLGHLKTLSLLANCLPQTTGGHTRQETALFWVGPWEILGDTRVALVQPSMLLCAKDSPDAGAGVKCTCISFFFLFFPVCFSLRLLGFAQWSLWGWSTGRELKLEKACHFLSLMHFKQGMFINLTYFSHQARSKMHGASAL